MKTRNDSMGSSSTTDRELPLNLSNLSTTPTFSNVMLPQNGTNDQPMSPAMMAKTTQSPNQDKVAQVTADGNGISSTQSISGYNYQPMHTFSFSRLTSSQMPSSIQLPSSIDANNLTAMTTNSSYNVPPTVDKALLNAQPFGMQSNAVGNRWGNMLFRAANTGPALVEKRRYDLCSIPQCCRSHAICFGLCSDIVIHFFQRKRDTTIATTANLAKSQYIHATATASNSIGSLANTE